MDKGFKVETQNRILKNVYVVSDMYTIKLSYGYIFGYIRYYYIYFIIVHTQYIAGNILGP